ncbi:MAG: TonB-dependent receptor [Phycisphaerales bacterium]|nr:TonB-dependent receptor [Hyphomonadaceae bacterium]
MLSKKLLSGAALTALSLSMGGVANAQSTGSQVAEDEVIVVTGQRANLEGAIVAETAPRARATITEDYIETQAAGQTILETINLIPGVNFTNTDAFGSSGGAINMRGFDGARISLTFDGIPLNDTGNYAIYSNQQVDPELIQRANVNLGTTDVDSPTAAATGGTINYITRIPDEEAGLMVSYARGTENFNRIFGMVETGAIGPFGTRAYLGGSQTEYDQFVGPGDLQKRQINGGLYQPLGDNGDFMRLSFHYNENRNDFYYRFSRAQYNAGFRENLATCTPLPGVNGVVDNSANDGCTASNFRVFQGHSINPSNTGNIRGASRFTLSDALTFTFDPSFQYVRANGGGTSVISETARQLREDTPVAGIDLNQDGDILDSVRLYSPSNTNTYRYGAISSLIWDVNDHHRVRFGYTYDMGRHRQTGEFGYLRANGDPENEFGGDLGAPIFNGDGEIFQKRDRSSIATLNQLSAEWRGDFANDTVTVVLGLRAPQFERDLDQNCFAAKGSTSSTQYCTTQTPDTPGALDPNLGLVSGGFVWFDNNGNGTVQTNEIYAPPFEASVEYDDVLPNFGITFRPMDGHQVFFSYAEGISSPRTDDLYSGITVAQLGDVQLETTSAYDVGYRYQNSTLLASATVWYNQFENRIERSADPSDPSLFFSRNVGAVDLWGAEAAIGFQASDALFLYGAASWTDSEVQSSGAVVVDTPDWTFTARGEYEIGPVTLGAQASYVGERFANDANTEIAEAYTTVDLDARYSLGQAFGGEETFVQLNVINLFDEEYFGQLSSGTGSGAGLYNLGAPQTVMVSLRTQF